MPWHFLPILLLSLSASATDQLPDSAPADQDNDQEMSQRLSAPLMKSDELEQLYLESPRLLETEEQRKGGESLRDELRYSETDLLERERRQAQQRELPPPLEIPLVTPPPLSRPEQL